MPYICKIRTDFSDGTLQVLDLWPNASQRSAIYDPIAQTKYLKRGEFTGAGQNAANGRPTTITATAHVTGYDTYGLAAYLCDTVTDNVTGVGITAAIANLAAAGVRDNLVDAGGVISDVTVSNELVATAGAGAGTTLLGAGLASVADVLQILAGGSYLLASGSAETVVVTLMGNGAFVAGTYRWTYDTGPLKISFGEGDLSEMMDATFDPVGDGTTGAAVVVYADDGTVYTG